MFYANDVRMLCALVAFLYIFLFWGIIFLVSFSYRAVVYLTASAGIFRMSRKAGIKGAIRAFFPFFRQFQLGRLAEESDRREGRRFFPYSTGYFTAVVCGRIFRCATGVVFFFFSVLLTAMFSAGSLPEDGILLVSTSGGLGADGENVMTGAMILGMLLCGGCRMLASLGILFFEAVVNFKVYKEFAGNHAWWLVFLTAFLPDSAAVVYLILSFREPKKSKGLHENLSVLNADICK